MDGISEIVMSLHFGCHIGINFAVFVPPTPKSISHEAIPLRIPQIELSPLLFYCSCVCIQKRGFHSFHYCQHKKLKLLLFLDFFFSLINILYFLSSVKILRLNHAELNFNWRFCVGVGRTRFGCVLRQDTKNVWKYKG